jgi:hypothetical protein
LNAADLSHLGSSSDNERAVYTHGTNVLLTNDIEELTLRHLQLPLLYAVPDYDLATDAGRGLKAARGRVTPRRRHLDDCGIFGGYAATALG